MPDKDMNEEEFVDLDQDKLVGQEINALYENGWFIREIKYFNKKLAIYMVSFTDGSEDYIDLDEIDDVDILLLLKRFDSFWLFSFSFILIAFIAFLDGSRSFVFFSFFSFFFQWIRFETQDVLRYYNFWTNLSLNVLIN